MSANSWEDLLDATDRTVIDKGGYAKKRGMGSKPVLLILDLQPWFIGLNKPLREQIADYPMGGGERAWQVVERILFLRDAAREAGVPVFYARTVQDQKNELNKVWPGQGGQAEPRLLSPHPDADLLDCLKPLPGELVIDKSQDSLFFGTPLDSFLTRLCIDTLIITGTSTSGSCRATCVDGITRTYNIGMVEDCLFERISASHKTALLDVWMKFGDVVDSAEMKTYFQSLVKERNDENV